MSCICVAAKSGERNDIDLFRDLFHCWRSFNRECFYVISRNYSSSLTFQLLATLFGYVCNTTHYCSVVEFEHTWRRLQIVMHITQVRFTPPAIETSSQYVSISKRCFFLTKASANKHLGPSFRFALSSGHVTPMTSMCLSNPTGNVLFGCHQYHTVYTYFVQFQQI